MAGIEPLPAAESLESPKAESEILWKKTTDQTGFAYSGKNSFKSGEGEFTTVGQGDSFAGSHAYLLLADVPGAEANSGASITAENSEGEAAFLSAETRGTGEQEASIGAGNELKTLLDQSGKSNFVQIPTVKKRLINCGEVSKVKVETNKRLGVAFTVEHGLGVTPVAFHLTLQIAKNYEVTFDCHVISRTSTKVEAQVTCSNAVPATIEVPGLWIAMG